MDLSVQTMDTASICNLSGNGANVDIIVLDWRALDETAFESMARSSTTWSNIPILFINGSPMLATQAADGGTAVKGSSSRGSMVSALKLAAALSRLTQPGTGKEDLISDKLVLQNARGFWNDTDLDLTIGEYRIIELLRSRPGQYFPYRAIYDRLRHEGFVSGHGPNGYRVNVRAAVKRIRNKFRALDPEFQEIQCYRAFGYRWRSPIDRGMRDRRTRPPRARKA
jgi:two-component system response regulator ChvI